MPSLPFYSRYTRGLHLRAELLNNVFTAVVGLAITIARKTLDASDDWITILTTAGPAANLTAIFWANAMEGRAKRPFILGAAVLGRLSLAFMAFAVEPPLFVLLCCLYFLSEPAFIPAQNALLQANYLPSIRGRVFGGITGVARIAYLVTALAAGWVLDHDGDAYRWMLPVAGVIGTAAYFQYARIRVRRWDAPETVKERGVVDALRGFLRILREDREFDRFERNFMLYGIAFMMVMPIHIYLLIDVLEMSYTQVTWCSMILLQVIIVIGSRTAGRLLDRLGPCRLAAIAFAALVGYLGLLACAAVARSVPLAFAGFGMFGIGMAGVNSAWSLGAMRFAGDRDASGYMGAHVACVGVRGLFGPAIGNAIFLAVEGPWLGLPGYGMMTVYVVAAILMAAAAIEMFRQGRRTEGTPAAGSAAQEPAALARG